MGFNFGILKYFLENAGFCQVERLQSFNLFSDTSLLEVKGYFISLNVAAKVCAEGDSNKAQAALQDPAFNVDHHGTPYVEGS